MKALFFGLGGVGQRHLRNLKALNPGCQVAAVRHKGRTFEISNDLKMDETVNIVEKYNVEVLPDMAAGLAFGPDLAVVANPSAKHVNTCLPLLDAKIPVFLEKPAATNRGDFQALSAASAASPNSYDA